MVANLLRYHTVVTFMIHQLISLTKEGVEWFTVPGGERGRKKERGGREREYYENNMIHTSNSTTK